MTSRIETKDETKEPAATAGAATPPTMFPIRSPGLAPLETVTPIKPSEAIRLGCLIAPIQLVRQAYVYEPDSACVYGAMALGLGGWDNVHDRANDLLWDERFSHDNLPSCPTGCGLAGDPIHLNDDHDWSRERIADYLEGLGL